jgi:isopentenyl-diphosphate delta-isomerase
MTDVILVDEHDAPIGTMEKLAAHQEGKLHRAFSVFAFDRSGRLLLQRRAPHKYHSAGLWTNTCCSHPAPDEDTEAAAHRRLGEEMGFDCPLTYGGHLLYRTEFDNGLIEHEFDHIYIGDFDGDPVLNLDEADAYRWISSDELLTEVAEHPERFTYWFRLALEDVLNSRSLAVPAMSGREIRKDLVQ